MTIFSSTINWSLHPNYGGPGRVYIPDSRLGIRSDVIHFNAENYALGTSLEVKRDSGFDPVVYVVCPPGRVWIGQRTGTGGADILSFAANLADAPIGITLRPVTE